MSFGESSSPLDAVFGPPDDLEWFGPARERHGEVDPAFGASPAHEYDTYLTSQRERYGLTENDLRAWTPPTTPRGRRRRS